MASINGLSGGMNTSALHSMQEEMNALKNQYKGNEIDSNEYREKMSELRERQSEERISAAAKAMEGVANSSSSLFAYMNNTGGSSSLWGSGTFDNTVFFAGAGDLSNLKAMNTARIGIENRARTLSGEIARDKVRGYDVTSKQEALSNLTGNLNVLNNNLSDSIEKAISNDKSDPKTVDIVEKLRNSLAASKGEETTAPEKKDEAESVAYKVAENNKVDHANAQKENLENTPEKALEVGVIPY